MVTFAIGAIFGGCVGMVVTALCVAAGEDSRNRERSETDE